MIIFLPDNEYKNFLKNSTQIEKKYSINTTNALICRKSTLIEGRYGITDLKLFAKCFRIKGYSKYSNDNRLELLDKLIDFVAERGY